MSDRKPLEERFWARVDKSGPDGCWLWMGTKLKEGYGQISVGPRVAPQRWLTHRLSWELANGPLPDGMKVDHQCHVKLCVNPSHLRLATTKQNAENRTGPQANNKSGYRGVSFNPARRAWSAIVQHNGRKVYGGFYGTPEEAAVVASELRRELFTHSDMDVVR